MTDDIGNFTGNVNGYLTASPVSREAVLLPVMSNLPKIVARIEQRLKQVHLKPAQAAKKAGLNVDAIRNMQRGLTKGTNTTTLQKLAPVLETTAAWLLEGEGDEHADHTEDRDLVPLVGYVGAGSATHFVPSGQLGMVVRPEWATASTVAFEIRGESLGAMFDHWIVYYDDVRRPVTSDLLGRLCVVGLADGRVLIKKIVRGTGGRFDLLSENEKPIKNVEIEWAGRVKQMSPR